MTAINFKKINIILPLISFFLMILVGYIMYSYWIPNFTDDQLSNIGIMGNDSALYHTFAKEIKNILLQNIFIKSDLFINKYMQFPHTYIAGLLYLIYDSPFIIIIFNSFLLSISVFYITQIANILSKNNEQNLILSILFTSICFFPSSIFIFNLNGKDPYIFLSVLIIFYNILFYNKINLTTYKKNILNINNITNIFFILLAVMFLSLIRPYVIYLIIASLFLSLVIILLINLIKNFKFEINILNISMFMIFILLSHLLFEILFSKYLQDLSLSPASIQKLKMSQFTIPGSFIWEYTKYIPNFLDEKIKMISGLRAHFINYNLTLNVIEAIKMKDITISDNQFTLIKHLNDLNFCTFIQKTSLVEKHIIPMNFYDFISYLPRLFLLSITSPTPEAWLSSKSILQMLSSMEMLFVYMILSSILINFKSLDANDLLLLFTSIIIICFYFYCNPNLGSFNRLRFTFFIYLMIIGFYNWLIISLNIYIKIKKIFFYNNNNKIYKKFSIFSLGSNVVMNSFLLLIFSFLIIIRDIFAINIFNLGNVLDIFFLSIIIISFMGNAFVSPIADSLSYLRTSNNKSIQLQFIDLIKNNFLITFLFIFLISLSLIFLNDYIISFFNIGKELNFNIFLYISPIIILIPVNAYLSSYFYNINKTFIPYSLQLLIPFFTIFAIFLNPTSIGGILITISILSIFNTILLIIFSNIYGINFKIFFQKKSLLLTLNKDYLRFFTIVLLCQISVALIIMYTYGLISNYNTDNFAIFTFAFKLVIFLSSFFVAISSGILTPFLKIKFIENEKDMFFGLIIVLYLIIFLSMILSLMFSIFMKPVFLQIFNLQNDKIEFINDTIGLSLLLVPLLIYIHIIQKILILRENFTFIIISNFLGLISFILLNYYFFSGELMSLIINLVITFSLIALSMVFLLVAKFSFKIVLILPLVIYFLFTGLLIYSISISFFIYLFLSVFIFLIIFIIIYNTKINIYLNE